MKLVKGIALGTILVGALSGCATKGQLSDVRQMAEEARAQAIAASERADSAELRAEAAEAKADEATAQIDNMFKKAMQK